MLGYNITNDHSGPDNMIAYLQKHVKHNIEVQHNEHNIFSKKDPPRMPIDEFVNRLNDTFQCDQACFNIALYYLGKLQEASLYQHSSPIYYITRHTVHRMLISTLLLATKFFEDHARQNAYYAAQAGISVAELDKLELEVFKAIGFNCYVDTDNFVVKDYYYSHQLHALKFVNIRHRKNK
ncbi:putative Cyclin [Blattamonas nauphoetae]|uniref:Cyclin n=1 Tax=Blattamonas nauphoetae TaxID=2049346 RepID=A0ABQ9XT50_9EUKA|nr:putative Cyclin [Blattamonas nauphoetae]